MVIMHQSRLAHMLLLLLLSPTRRSACRPSGVVSFSARLVAGMRALENREEEPLVRDPFAEELAGKRGLKDASGCVLVGLL